MLIYANATLTAITAAGTSEDYDSPAVAGTARWTGEAPATIRERIVEVMSPGRLDEVKETRMHLDWWLGQLVERGDTLTFTYEGDTMTRTAGTIAHAELADRVLVVLEDA